MSAAHLENVPELLAFRIDPEKKVAVLTLHDGRQTYEKELDLTQEGAGLRRMVTPAGHVHLASGYKRLSRADLLGGSPFERWEREICPARTSCDMAAALALAFWGREVDLTGWPE